LQDAATGKVVRQLQVQEIAVDALAFSPDGQTVAALSRDSKFYLWEVATGRELQRFDREQQNHPSCCLVFSPDGKTRAAGGSKVSLWNVATGKKRWQFPGTVWSVAFSPDGKMLAAGGGCPGIVRGFSDWDEPIIYFREAATGKELRRLTWPQVDWTKIKPFAPVPPGAKISNVGGVWGVVTAVAFSPDGKMLFSGGSDEARLWEVATGQQRRLLEGHEGNFYSAAFAPDGRTLAVSSGDNKIRIWDAVGWWHDIKPSLKELETHWTDLASDDATKGYRALCTLVHWPDHTVPFLRQRLQPIPKAQVQRIAQLIADLDSPQFAVRQQATAELEQLGDAAEPALQHVLAGQPSLEVRQRAERLLAKVRAAPISGERLRVLRAMEVLEYIGTPAVRPILASLAQGAPEDPLTQEAKASLERLTKRRSAPP
jgi:hypothetical protein